MVMNKSKYAEIGRRAREIPLETHLSSYEWEELVQKLCSSDDAVLRDIGVKELYDLLRRCPERSGMQKDVQGAVRSPAEASAARNVPQ